MTAPDPNAVKPAEAVYGALVALRAAIDDAEVADHIPKPILDLVDYVIEKEAP